METHSSSGETETSNDIETRAPVSDFSASDFSANLKADKSSRADTEVARENAHGRGVTPRVVAFCLALAFGCGYVIPVIDHKLGNTFLGAQHLPPGAIAVLLVFLLVINPVLRVLSQRSTFSRNELLTVYIVCLFAMLVPGHGGETFFISNVIGPFYFATPENKWLQNLEGHLPNWLTPALQADGSGHFGPLGREAVTGWYSGLAPGQGIPWDAWLVPLLAWGSLVVASYVMLGCLSVILRAQWAQREALAFPLLKLPLEMTEDVDKAGHRGEIGAFFRNPLMWIGFGIAASVQLVNGLRLYFPDVPAIPLGLDTAPYLSEAPWNQIGWTPLMIFPIAVGIAYLLTSEVSFSFWFFYWFVKFQLIAAYLVGFQPSLLPSVIGAEGGARAFVAFQQIGAYFAFASLVLWTGREHFSHVIRRAFGRAKAKEGEGSEALSYPLAFWGFVLAFAFMVAWSVAAGVRPSLAIALWGTYVVMAIALTRVLVESGLLFLGTGWTPLGPMAQLLGSGPGHWMAPSSVVPAAFLQGGFFQDMRAFALPSFVQGFKLAHDRGIAARPLAALIFAVMIIALAMSAWMHVRLGYQNGGLSLEWWYSQGGAQIPAQTTQDLIGGARDTLPSHWFWFGLGMLLTLGMMLARSRFLWFPFHPIGFLVAISYPLHKLWFSIFLGWGCKTLITRFGGTDTARRLTPMFLGLILGDVSMYLFWLVIDGWQGRVLHNLAV